MNGRRAESLSAESFMQEQLPPMHAAIDIGSNTIHIVVARCTPENLDIVEDQLELVRIGESVTTTGEISPQKRDAAINTLRKYQALAQQHGAGQILVIATEAIRQAHNSADFLEDVKRETGLEVRLISGEAEAAFTFYGATYWIGPDASARVGVLDLGGGSMELVTSQNKQITWRVSIPIGSGWLHDRYLPSNPPTRNELANARLFLRTYFQGMRMKHRPPVLVVTGGSATSLLYLARCAFGLDAQSNRLTRMDLAHCEGLLSALTAEEISERYAQEVGRARILPAGALIIRTMMQRLRLSEILVSSHGIREGVLLSYARCGERWLECAEEGTEASNNRNGAQGGTQKETFVHAGRRMLQERTKKMLEWRDEVLKDEDIEALHKMRVASRRLRAVLDAYESCCDPQLFRKVYRRVKKATDVLGAVRDTDIMLQSLHTELEQAPVEERAGIQWLIAHLSVYRQQRQQKLEKFLAKFDEDTLKQQIDACIPNVGAD